MKAVELLSSPFLPPDVVVDILQNASNICKEKNEFSKAKLLINESLRVTRECYGENHPKYAQCLIDYGRYLQKVDMDSAGLEAIKTGVEILLSILGEMNQQVAIASRFTCIIFAFGKA